MQARLNTLLNHRKEYSLISNPLQQVLYVETNGLNTSLMKHIEGKTDKYFVLVLKSLESGADSKLIPDELKKYLLEGPKKTVFEWNDKFKPEFKAESKVESNQPEPIEESKKSNIDFVQLKKDLFKKHFGVDLIDEDQEKKVYLEAVKKDVSKLQFIKYQTEEICMEALKTDFNADRKSVV